MDDFLFAALLKALCDGQLDVFLEICKVINFPVAMEKMVWGQQIIAFLGMLLNTISQTISILEEKWQKAITLINEITSKKKATVLRLQQITGLLNNICRAVPGDVMLKLPTLN